MRRRRKAAFLERKRKKIEQWAAEAAVCWTRNCVRRARNSPLRIKRQWLAVLCPLWRFWWAKRCHVRLYLKVMDRIREDADVFERKVQALL